MASTNDEGWQVAGRKTRKPLTRQQREERERREAANHQLLQAAMADQRMPKPAPKPKPKPAKPDSKGGAEAEDEDRPVKMHVISADKRSRLQQMRTRKGLSRKQLAQRLNVIERVVADYENGKGSYDPGLYNRLIQTLGKLPDKSTDSD